MINFFLCISEFASKASIYHQLVGKRFNISLFYLSNELGSNAFWSWSDLIAELIEIKYSNVFKVASTRKQAPGSQSTANEAHSWTSWAEMCIVFISTDGNMVCPKDDICKSHTFYPDMEQLPLGSLTPEICAKTRQNIDYCKFSLCSRPVSEVI